MFRGKTKIKLNNGCWITEDFFHHIFLQERLDGVTIITPKYCTPNVSAEKGKKNFFLSQYWFFKMFFLNTAQFLTNYLYKFVFLGDVLSDG